MVRAIGGASTPRRAATSAFLIMIQKISATGVFTVMLVL
jgi:hypothetical protein